MSERGPATPPQRNVARGIWRLARLKREGFAEFAATPQAFLSSLAPLLAFPLVGGVLMLFRGYGLEAVTDMLATVIAVLAPPMISASLAERWGQGGRWLHFATAFNWAQWAVPVVGMGLLLAAGILRQVGFSENGAVMVWLFGIAAYAIVLHWFLARQGLGVSGGQAALMVVGMNFGTAVLVLGPRWVASSL